MKLLKEILTDKIIIHEIIARAEVILTYIYSYLYFALLLLDNTWYEGG